MTSVFGAKTTSVSAAGFNKGAVGGTILDNQMNFHKAEERLAGRPNDWRKKLSNEMAGYCPNVTMDYIRCAKHYEFPDQINSLNPVNGIYAGYYFGNIATEEWNEKNDRPQGKCQTEHLKMVRCIHGALYKEYPVWCAREHKQSLESFQQLEKIGYDFSSKWDAGSNVGLEENNSNSSSSSNDMKDAVQGNLDNIVDGFGRCTQSKFKEAIETLVEGGVKNGEIKPYRFMKKFSSRKLEEGVVTGARGFKGVGMSG